MRIRSIRPEFWTSEDIAALDWTTRLIFIGLWSYVDDNGVGRDVAKLIKADLFPLEDDPHGALMQVAGALRTLQTGGQICRYKSDGKPLLHICAWDKNQVISRPSKGRYERLTCTDARSQPNTHANDMSPLANVPLGEGEKGRRGEGEKGKNLRASALSETDRFDEFWNTYNKKRGRAAAEKKWLLALKKPNVTPDLLIAAAGEYVTWERTNNDGGRFIMDAARWLNGEHWTDERVARPQQKGRAAQWLDLAEKLAADDAKQIGRSE